MLGCLHFIFISHWIVTCQLCHTPSLSASSVPKIFSAVQWKSPAYTSHIPCPLRSEFSLTMRRRTGEVIILRLCLSDLVASQSISKIYSSGGQTWQPLGLLYKFLFVPQLLQLLRLCELQHFHPLQFFRQKSRVTVFPLLQVQLSRTSCPTFMLFSLFTLNSFLSLTPVVSLSLSLFS